MKISTWNVNSVRARIVNIFDYIKQSDPDILFLQEIKTQDENFPIEEFKIKYKFMNQKIITSLLVISLLISLMIKKQQLKIL